MKYQSSTTKMQCRHVIPSRHFWLALLLMLLVHITTFAANFTAGNLTVLRMGNGSETLGATGNSIFIDEYTTNGTLVQSISVPNTYPSGLIINGGAGTEGFMDRSPDKRLLCFMGYNTNIQTSGSIQASNGAALFRGIGKVNNSGTFTLVATTTSISANSPRGGTTDGAGNFWGTGGANSILYFSSASGAQTTIGGQANGRTVAIFNNKLYYATASASGGSGTVGVSTFNSAYPTAAGATASTVINAGSTAGANTEDFAINSDGTILYQAIDSAANGTPSTTGGIQKWTFSGGVWSSNYTIGVRCRALTVDFSGLNPVIYATDSSTAPNSALLKIVDTGSTVSSNLLATAGSSKLFRGIRFAPLSTPQISSQPSSKYPTNDGTGIAIFSVSADGGLPLAYQWRKGGVNLSNTGNVTGSTTTSLTITGADISGDVGSYDVVVSNTDGSTTSSTAVLAIAAAPTISIDPQSTTNIAGTTATFSVTGSGAPPPTYQWYSNAVALANGGTVSGATSATLTVGSVTTGQDGNVYRVVLSNINGTATSANATLTVVTTPSITQQPQDSAVTEGQGASFSVVASGTAPLSYQWRENGSPIAGATDPVYSIGTTTLAQNGNSYTVVVTNLYGSATSSTAVLTVTASGVPPSITTQPADTTVTVGNNTTLSVVAAGSPTLLYTWQKGDGSPITDGNISGANTSTLSFTAATVAQSNTTYRVVVNNGFGSATSSTATLTVTGNPPTINTGLSDKSVIAGSNAVFTVSASGTGTLYYSWKKDGNNLSDTTGISGSSTASLTVGPSYTTDAGTYMVTVTNLVGTATSSAALTVTLPVPPTIVGISSAARTLNAGGNGVTIVSSTNTTHYQWQKNGSDLVASTKYVGVTNTVFSVASLAAADTGTYTVVATNYGGISSSNFVITVLDPVVSTQPAGMTISPGGTITLSVVAAGTSPFTYQWLQNGSPISGATASSYSKAGATIADAGNYSCLITNALGGNTNSSTAAVFVAQSSTPFYKTNLVILRLGDGTTAPTANGTPVYLDQYTTSGSYVSTMQIPTTGTTALVQAGNSTAEGHLIRSPNKNYLTFVGYNTNVQSSSVPGTTATRAVATITGTGGYSLVTNTAYTGANIRSGVTDGSGNYWTAGSANGVYYFGTNSSLVLVETAISNLRVVDIFNGTLYFSTGSGTRGIYAMSSLQTAGPATAGTITLATGSTSSPYDFAFNSDGTIAYVADDSAASAGGGIVRFDKVAGNYTLSYVMTTGGTSGSRSFTADFSGAQPVIYATTTDNRLVQIVDMGDAESSTETDLAVVGGNATYRGVKFGPETPPTINTQPASQTVAFASSATFSVSVTGTGTISYQWKKNGSNISGANASSYTIPSVALGDVASYSVAISDNLGSATSGSATLHVSPGFTSQPSGTSVNYGSQVVLTGAANGEGTVTYQWQKGGVNVSNGGTITGATTSSLSISGAVGADTGSYTLVASATYGSATSSTAVLTVTDPNITSQPSNLSIGVGTNATFNVGAAGTSLSYQWYKSSGALSNGGNITGATSSTLTVAGATLGDSDTYYVVVTGYNTATSSSATLSVGIDPPAIDSDPASQTANAGTSAIFTAAAHGTGISYQWELNGSGLTDGAKYSGVSTPSLTVANVLHADQGSYSVHVTGVFVGVDSLPGILTVIDPVIGNPTSGSVNKGSTIVLNATGAGTGAGPGGAPSATFKYQWYFKGTNATAVNYVKQAGKTNATFTITAASTAVEGNYFCTLTNIYSKDQYPGTNVAHSAAAYVTVNIPITAVPVVPAMATKIAGNNVAFIAVPTAAATKPISYQWALNGVNLTDDGIHITGATANKLSINDVQAPDAGTYQCTVQNASGSVTSLNTQGLLTVNADITKPVSLITSPLPNARLTNAVNTTTNNVTTAVLTAPNFVLTGKAVDNGLVTDVSITQQYYNSAGVLQTLSPVSVTLIGSLPGLKTWTNNFVLHDGTNIFTAVATDSGTNHTTSVARKFFFVRTNALTVNDVSADTFGTGTDTPGTIPAAKFGFGQAANGAHLEVGRKYTIKGIAGFGCFCTNITDGDATVLASGSVGVNPTATFIMKDDLVINVNFATNPIVAAGVAGSYNGLYAEDSGATLRSAGFSTLLVKTNLSFSGSTKIGGRTFGVSGKFNLSGDATATVNRLPKGLSNLVMTLHLDWVGATKQITGTVTNTDPTDPWVSRLTNDLAGLYLSQDARYTAYVPRGAGFPTTSPGGFGGLVITNNALGKMLMLAPSKLGDGVLVSQVVDISKDGNAPVFVQLYKDTSGVFEGIFQGWLHFNKSGGTVTGSMNHIRTGDAPSALPAVYTGGFSNLHAVTFGRVYTPPAPGTRAVDLSIDNNQFTFSVSGPFLSWTLSLGANNVFTRVDGATNKISGSITPGTGAFTITFLPTGVGPASPATLKTVSGVVETVYTTGEDFGFGTFTGSGQTVDGQLFLPIILGPD